jgi:predicted DNA-binding transcriptional regulator AlpA
LSQQSTASSRRERRDAVARGAKLLAGGCVPRCHPPTSLLVVYSLSEAAAIVGVARRTIERLVARGEGPAVIDLSPRRRGVLESDLISWLRKSRRTGRVHREFSA